MTPREKAHDLLKKYFMIYQSYPYNREAALIAVDEILFSGVHKENYYLDKSLGYTITFKEYYQEVKQEILSIDREITRAESQEARADKFNEDLY
jgi:hypothetical protein